MTGFVIVIAEVGERSHELTTYYLAKQIKKAMDNLFVLCKYKIEVKGDTVYLNERKEDIDDEKA